MANKIVLKKSSVAAKVPLSTDLEVGEIAVNLVDQKLYSKKADGTVVLVGTGSGGAGDVVGPASATDNAIVRFDSTTGKLIQNSSVTIDDNGNANNVNAVSFDTTPATLPTTEGSMYWDADKGAVAFIMQGGDVVQEIGESQYLFIQASANITKGQVVMFTGAIGGSGIPTGAPATGVTDGTYIMGIAAEDITSGTSGFVQTFGILKPINTTGIATGTILWYDPTVTGGFTSTKPVAPNIKVQLAAVTAGNSSGGAILIRVSAGSELGGTDSNVTIASPVNGNTLIYDSSTGVWKNETLNLSTQVTSTLPVANGGTGLTSVTANRIPYGNGTSALQTSANLTFDGATLTNTGNVVISDNSANAALRITQTGAGNALLVEDSANPDSTPFVIESAGRVLTGYTAATTTANYSGTAVIPNVQQHGTSLATSAQSINIWNSGSAANTGQLLFSKSKSDTIGTNTLVTNGDFLGAIAFNGADGTNFVPAASIIAAVDGTPGTNDMPARLVFSTTADGASSPTEAMRIDQRRNIGIGGASAVGRNLSVLANATGATNTTSVYAAQQIQSDVTGNADIFVSAPSTAAASFTLSNLRHFRAFQNTFGATSAVTNQFGFAVESSLTGATNNFGFYSNIASGTGRWNFYAAGSAENFFGGATTISANSTTDALRITQTGTGNALLVEDSANPDSTPFVVNADGVAILGSTSAATGISGSQLQVIGDNAANHINIVRYQTTSASPSIFSNKANGTKSSPAIVSNNDGLLQIAATGYDGANFIQAARIVSEVDGTPGTNDMPGRLVFSTTADGASSPTERMRIDSAGRVGIGTSPATFARINFAGTAPSTFNLSYGIRNATVIENASINSYVGIISELNTQATSWTLPTLIHYGATPVATFGAGSVVTSQIGFIAQSSLTGATNNFGFRSDIASGTGRWNFYAAGSANNYFAGNVGIGTTPGTQLDVSGAWFAGVGTMRINGASGQQYSGFTVANNGSVRTYFYDDNTNNYTFIGATTGKALVFATNTGGTDGERMRIFASGGVSIGNTTDPGATNLSVTGTITAATFPSPQLTTAPYVNGSYRGNIVAVAALDIDCSAGNYFTKTINGASTFTFSNAPASRSYSFTLELTQTSGAVTWPAAVQWPGGTAPTLTAGKTHLFMFVTDDGGTRWRGAALVNYTN